MGDKKKQTPCIFGTFHETLQKRNDSHKQSVLPHSATVGVLPEPSKTLP
jgi:hypothetical protein